MRDKKSKTRQIEDAPVRFKKVVCGDFLMQALADAPPGTRIATWTRMSPDGKPELHIQLDRERA